MVPVDVNARDGSGQIIGLFWRAEGPVLVTSVPGEPDHRRSLEPGAELRLRLDGPRTCVGVWDTRHGRRVACATEVNPSGTDAQCARCARQDRGRALARDRHTDDRDYVLYLAFFGPGLLKVGLTAAERGHRRLLEQGALTYTLLAHGPLSAIRAAERAVAAAGIAKERLRGTTKSAAWWRIPPSSARWSAVRTARQAVDDSGLLTDAEPLDAQVHDNVATFALDEPLPDTYDVLTGLDDPAVLALRVRAVPGRLLLADGLDTAAPLLIDTRLLDGYRATPTDEPGGGLHTTPRARPRDADHDQPGLF